MSPIPEHHQTSWSQTEIFLFRFFALFFIIQSLPLDPQFFRQLFSIGGDGLQYNEIFNLSHFSPRFFAGADSFANWGVVLLLSFAGSFVWARIDKPSKEYNNLYYWVRVVVRYRLAIAIIAYGFIKFYPIQSPYPSLSNLNTNYGDFNRWKLFSLSLGIVPNYQSFLGLVEIVMGLLLLFRTTATIGAFSIVVFTGNVFMSNLGYEGGEYVYSFYLLSFALFLLVFDLQRLISLLILQRPTAPNRFRPQLKIPWQRYTRLAFKTFILFFFVVVYGFKTRSGLKNGLSLYPSTPGLKGVAGVYNVPVFTLNNDTLAYSKSDPVRWQDVIFEQWNTVSIKSNKRVIPDTDNVTVIPSANADRLYELEGAIERHYYSYETDTIANKLFLKNRNRNHVQDSFVLRYEKEPNGDLLLTGVTSDNDSLHVVLQKINKKYLLEEAAKVGRRSRLKL